MGTPQSLKPTDLLTPHGVGGLVRVRWGCPALIRSSDDDRRAPRDGSFYLNESTLIRAASSRIHGNSAFCACAHLHQVHGSPGPAPD